MTATLDHLEQLALLQDAFAATIPDVDPRLPVPEVHDRHAVDLTHSQCLEIVARQLGADSWDVLAATLHHDDAADGGPAASASTSSPEVRRFAWGAASTTIPVMRVFSVDAAKEFYVDFLRFTLDFGGPAGGPGTPFYGQVTRQTTTLHLTEQAYDPRPGTTVLIQMIGLEALWEEPNERRETVLVWGPAVWVPDIEAVPWGAHTLTIPDPFGNHLRFDEPDDPAERAELPVWAGG